MHAQCYSASTSVLTIGSNLIALVIVDFLSFNISFQILQLLSFEIAVSWVYMNFLQITKLLSKITVEQFLIQIVVGISESSILFQITETNLCECCQSFLVLLNIRAYESNYWLPKRSHIVLHTNSYLEDFMIRVM